MKYAILLAAGKGTRMKTDLPKGAFPVNDRPMIIYSIEALQNSHFDKINVVVGHKKEILMDILTGFNCDFSEQTELNGTAKAVESSKGTLEGLEGNTLILPVDMPLVTSNLINELVNYHEENKNDLTVLSTKIDNPFSYGRIIRDENGDFLAIKEELDTTLDEKKINEINSGVYVVDNKLLFKALSKVNNNNNKQEYYLTDIVSILKGEGKKVQAYIYSNSIETTGVNDLYTKSIVEKEIRNRINKELMLNGVNIINPDTVTIGSDVIIGQNCTIEPNTHITGGTVIGSGSRIGPNTELINATIGENVWIRHSIVSDSSVGNNTTVGPFSHLRNKTHIGEKNRVGNFVEFKNTTTGFNTKASHLSYLGDSNVGSSVNFGCGCITVNYDGKNKWHTEIGDNVFVGSNSNLIAPIKIEKDSFIAAGSTINKNVPEGALAIAREYQVTKPDYAQILRKRAELKSKQNNK